MSFGFSVGDFVAVGLLIKDIVCCLNESDGAAAEYQEAIRELLSLQVALDGICNLSGPGHQDASIRALHCMALSCQYALDDFSKRLKKYQSLGSSISKYHSFGKKVKWQVAMKDEVQKLRMYINVHSASLNMQMAALGLQMTYSDAKSASSNREYLEQKISDAQNAVLGALKSQLVTTNQGVSLTEKIFGLISGVLGPQLATLIDLGKHLLENNYRIYRLLMQLNTNLPQPDVRHTWFQEPIHLTDVLGNSVTLLPDFDWTTVEMIIEKHCKKTSPLAYEKVLAGEWELFLDEDCGQLITASDFEDDNSPLRPGMKITMGIIFGQYVDRSIERCPKPGCKAIATDKGKSPFLVTDFNGKKCTKCRVSFSRSAKSLPLPHRDTFGSHSSSKDPQTNRNSFLGNQEMKKRRLDRLGFKHIKIHAIPLPPTPEEIATMLRRRSSRTLKRERDIAYRKYLEEGSAVILLNPESVTISETTARDEAFVSSRKWSCASNYESHSGSDILDSNGRRRNTANLLLCDQRMPYKRKMTVISEEFVDEVEEPGDNFDDYAKWNRMSPMIQQRSTKENHGVSCVPEEEKMISMEEIITHSGRRDSDDFLRCLIEGATIYENWSVAQEQIYNSVAICTMCRGSKCSGLHSSNSQKTVPAESFRSRRRGCTIDVSTIRGVYSPTQEEKIDESLLQHLLLQHIFERELIAIYGSQYKAWYDYVGWTAVPPHFRLRKMYRYDPSRNKYPLIIPLPYLLAGMEMENLLCAYPSCDKQPAYINAAELQIHYAAAHENHLPAPQETSPSNSKLTSLRSREQFRSTQAVSEKNAPESSTIPRTRRYTLIGNG